MRLVVDLTKCQGYAQCAFLAPEVFTIQGDEALTYGPPRPVPSRPSDSTSLRRRTGRGLPKKPREPLPPGATGARSFDPAGLSSWARH